MCEDHGRDEELAEVERSRWLATTARRRVAGAAVVAVLVALVSVRLAAAHRGSDRAVRALVPTPRPTSATIGPSPIDVTPGRPNFRKDDPAFCPGRITCVTLGSVPPGVLAAIRQYLPHARPNNVSSVVQARPDRLYFRQVDASAKDVTVLVRVTRASRGNATRAQGTDNPPGQSIGAVRVVTDDGFVVEVAFIGPPGYLPPMGAIRALAVDPRLLTLG